MATLTLELDPATESTLRRLSQQDGGDIARTAAHLLARAVRAARPRRLYNTDAIRAANAPFEGEDEALAESGIAERAELLAQEDQA